MSDTGAIAFPAQLAETCGFCEDSNEVTWFCKSCAESMCNTCKISHPTILIFRQYIVIPLTNDVMPLYGQSKIAEHCQFHPEKEISAYCNDCLNPSCAICFVQNHQKHDISTIEEKYLSANNSLNDRATELEKDVLPTLDKMADKTEKDRSEMRVQIDRVKKEVNTFRKELKQAVDNSCDDLIEKLGQNDIEFDNSIAILDAKKTEVRELIKEVNDPIQNRDFSLIKYYPPSPRTLIPEKPTIKRTIPIFTPGRDILTTFKEKIGTVQWIDRNSKSDDTQSLTSIFDPSMTHVNKVTSFMCEIDVTSIKIAGKNTTWIMNLNSDTMYLYDSNGKVVRYVAIQGSNGIHDMVIRGSGEMIVTCWDRKVRCVSVSGEVSILINSSPFRPHGICPTEKEEVVVCMRDQGENNHVAVHSPDTGGQLREMRGIDSQGKQQITNPNRVVFNGKDLCVVNVDPGNVVCVDEKSNSVRWVYDSKEAKRAEKFDPREISIDKYNNILVTDCKIHCIHYIDREVRLIHIILPHEQTGLSYPRGICVDDNTGHLWVGNKSGNVVMCKYLS